MRSRSISTTGTPKEAAIAATDKPPEPAPITQRSGLRTLAHEDTPRERVKR